MRDLLRGGIDVHVHGYPDVRRRVQDDLELVRSAHDAGMRGLMLKSHIFSTVERAYLAGRIYPEIGVWGGIALNDTVGGLNPMAAAAALELGAAEVWMPTVSAAHHARHVGGDGTLSISGDGGRLRSELADILERIAAHGAILGTGHISPEEAAVLIPAAVTAGVRMVLVTHPEWEYTAIPVALQQEWAESGRVLFERCLVSTAPEVKGSVSFETIVEQIGAVGVATTVISTDYGLATLPPPVDGMREYVARLLAAGFSEGEIRTMLHENPARALGVQGLAEETSNALAALE